MSVPHALSKVMRQAPCGAIETLPAPPERFGFAQAGQAYADGTMISAISASAANSSTRFIALPPS
ncbi:MAG TPA: hypothetical protein VFN10_14105 [Thermoanaerobaculia bacterium]|nr:hypothetical protein [Thermoanaerobaculia bacterium]